MTLDPASFIITVLAVWGGVFAIMKFLINGLKADIKEDIIDCKKTATRAHSRIDKHLENHHL